MSREVSKKISQIRRDHALDFDARMDIFISKSNLSRHLKLQQQHI